MLGASLTRELDPGTSRCPFCSSDQLKRFRAVAHDSEEYAEVSIVECNECVFSWQHPFGRSEEESLAHFERNYQLGALSQSRYFDLTYKQLIAEMQLWFVSTLRSKKGSVLDAGAGAGIFATQAASAGYDVTALDPALDVGSFPDCSGITAVRGTFSSLPEGTQFDVITLWDVIEHAVSPIELLSQAKSLLKPNGCLVLSSGNYKSAERVQGGSTHWIYQLDHRWYFSPESIECTLRDMGFRSVVHCDRTLRPGCGPSTPYLGPSRLHFLRSSLADPKRLYENWRTFCKLKAATRWPFASTSVFALGAFV